MFDGYACNKYIFSVIPTAYDKYEANYEKLIENKELFIMLYIFTKQLMETFIFACQCMLY